MKKVVFLILMVLMFKLSTEAQTTFWSDDFYINQGDWTIDDDKWRIGDDMLFFYHFLFYNGYDYYCLSPVIHLLDNANEMIVNQYIYIPCMSQNEIVEISIIYDDQEEILWSYQASNGAWGGELSIPVNDYAGMDVQFKFRTYGISTTNSSYWNIHNIKINAGFNSDLTAIEVTGPNQIDLQTTGIWNVNVKNLGTQTVSGFTVELFDYKTGELVGSFEDSEQIQSGETKSYSFEWSSDTSYSTVFYGDVIFDGDEFPENNNSKSFFVRVNPDIDFNILVWDNDNDVSAVLDPENLELVPPPTVLIRALYLAGYDYDFCVSLPDNLDDYDIIFATMGSYCTT